MSEPSDEPPEETEVYRRFIELLQHPLLPGEGFSDAERKLAQSLMPDFYDVAMRKHNARKT